MQVFLVWAETEVTSILCCRDQMEAAEKRRQTDRSTTQESTFTKYCCESSVFLSQDTFFIFAIKTFDNKVTFRTFFRTVHEMNGWMDVTLHPSLWFPMCVHTSKPFRLNSIIYMLTYEFWHT